MYGLGSVPVLNVWSGSILGRAGRGAGRRLEVCWVEQCVESEISHLEQFGVGCIQSGPWCGIGGVPSKTLCEVQSVHVEQHVD